MGLLSSVGMTGRNVMRLTIIALLPTLSVMISFSYISDKLESIGFFLAKKGRLQYQDLDLAETSANVQRLLS